MCVCVCFVKSPEGLVKAYGHWGRGAFCWGLAAVIGCFVKSPEGFFESYGHLGQRCSLLGPCCCVSCNRYPNMQISSRENTHNTTNMQTFSEKVRYLHICVFPFSFLKDFYRHTQTFPEKVRYLHICVFACLGPTGR